MALWLWYRGDGFRGYQRQPDGPTVQGHLEQALSKLDVKATPSTSGRTDLCVHARMQVVSFRTPEGRSPESLHAQLPPLLPPGLGLVLARRTSRAFHAQWSCSGKEYRYRFRLGPSPGWDTVSWNVSDHPRILRPVDPSRVAELLSRAQGTRDFIAFHEKSSPRKLRTLERAECVEAAPGLFEVRLSGSGFGRYQVRYLVGSAVATAAGTLSEEQWHGALEAGLPMDGVRAPPEGLILWEVHYPSEVDPFSPSERGTPPDLPREPPFVSP